MTADCASSSFGAPPWVGCSQAMPSSIRSAPRHLRKDGHTTRTPVSQREVRIRREDLSLPGIQLQTSPRPLRRNGDRGRDRDRGRNRFPRSSLLTYKRFPCSFLLTYNRFPRSSLLTYNRFPRSFLFTYNRFPRSSLFTYNRFPRSFLLTCNRFPRSFLLTCNHFPHNS